MAKDLLLDFGSYSVDLRRIIRYLKQDMVDDWFKDPIHFRDKFDNQKIVEYFSENIRSGDGIYTPTYRLLYNIPKKQSTLRYSLETCFYDRLAYHAFGVELIQAFDHLISPRILSHRFNLVDSKHSKARYLFYHSIEQWKKYDQYTKMEKEKVSVVTDVQNYFEHIDIGKLETVLLSCLRLTSVNGKEKSKIRYCIDSIVRCLGAWSYDGKRGLPQNRDISSFLANIYMLPVDSYMIDNGYDYFRYMDDIRIVCRTRSEGRLAIKRLSVKLREYGLTLNGAKTGIFCPGTDEHKRHFSETDFHLERIDALFKSKKKPIVAIAFDKVKDGIENCIAENDFDSRQFRFYLNRISKIALCDDIEKPKNYFRKIEKNLIESIWDYPTNMDSYFSLLSVLSLSRYRLRKIAHFLLNEEDAVYSWQNYLVWKLLIIHEYKNRTLVNLARRTFCTDSADPMRMGAALYIGAFGSRKDREKILSGMLPSDSFNIQRHVLIACQEEPYEIIKPHAEKIHESNIGTYRKLKNVGNFQYVDTPNRIKATDLFNSVSFYV